MQRKDLPKNFTSYIHEQISQLAPIVSVSLKDVLNPRSWDVIYDDSANDQQKAAVRSYLVLLNVDQALIDQIKIQDKINHYKDEPMYKFEFKRYKAANPSATFKDFLDYLNS